MNTLQFIEWRAVVLVINYAGLNVVKNNYSIYEMKEDRDMTGRYLEVRI